MEKIDNIKTLYKQVWVKGDFIHLVALDLKLSWGHVRNQMFSAWVIPEKYQDRIIELLQNTIKTQR